MFFVASQNLLPMLVALLIGFVAGLWMWKLARRPAEPRQRVLSEDEPLRRPYIDNRAPTPRPEPEVIARRERAGAAMAGEVGDLRKGGYTLNHAIAATGLTIPWRAYNLFPTSAVIGSLLGLGQLAASSELTALRAVGLSRRRLSVSVAFSLALMTALMKGMPLEPAGRFANRAAADCCTALGASAGVRTFEDTLARM